MGPFFFFVQDCSRGNFQTLYLNTQLGEGVDSLKPSIPQKKTSVLWCVPHHIGFFPTEFMGDTETSPTETQEGPTSS